MKETVDRTYGKRHRLCGKIRIDRLFSEGRSAFVYPVRLVWTLSDSVPGTEEPVRVMVSVSKRLHKRAVTRNLLKRRLREAYRIHRHLWDLSSVPEGKSLYIAFIYSSKEVEKFDSIQQAILRSIGTIQKRFSKGGDHPADPPC